MPIELVAKDEEFFASGESGTGEAEPAIARLAGGGFVIAWLDRIDFDTADIRAQLFAPDGTKLGEDFLIDSDTHSPTQVPSLIGLPSGGFLVVWARENAAGDDSRSGVVAQFYDFAGSPVGDRILVNSSTFFGQNYPRVTLLTSGGFVVNWEDEAGVPEDGDGGTAIRAQLFDSAGAKVGGEILVGSPLPGSQSGPTVSALASGGFVMAWSAQSAIKAQIFDASGNTIGGEIQVSTTTGGSFQSSSAGLPGGGFVVVWTTWAADGDENGVLGQVFDSSGARVGSEFVVNTVTEGSQLAPSVAALVQGGFLVTWSDLPFPTSVKGQVFDELGNKFGEEKIINGASNSNWGQSAIAQLTNNSVVVTWKDLVEIRARIFVPEVIGTEGGDSYFGTSSLDVYRGLGGNDVAAGGVGDDLLDGGSGDDRLDGGAGDDALNGGAGDDWLVGGLGDDVYDGGDGTDTVDYSDEAGPVAVNLTADLFFFPAGHPHASRSLGPGEALDGSGNYETLAGIENLILTGGDDRAVASEAANRIEAGAGNDNIVGAGGNDVLLGQAGNDRLGGDGGDDLLDGGTGADGTEGGPGNDTHYVDNGGDLVVEFVGGGSDTVATSISYVLTANVENLQALNIAGTAPLSLTGNGLANFIWGTQGNNVIDGGAGSDFMIGYAGDDIYHVDHAGDLTYEEAGGGSDTVAATVSYVLRSNIENLQAADIGGTAALALTGNAQNNFIWGTQGNNVIDGAGGADFMLGYGGDDLYLVDNGGDIAYEEVGGGTDTVATVISYTLAANVENLQAASIGGTAALSLTGNAQNNSIYATQGDNVIDGGAGVDFMAGYAGNDFYFVDNSNDVAYEDANGGSDTVAALASYALGANIENLQAANIGGNAALSLTGNDQNNFIWGTQGANVLSGRGGNDRIFGYAGADQFLFDTAAGAANADWLDDFQAGTDKILLDNSVFTALTDGALSSSAFVTGTAALDADDRIIFDAASGSLFYDADGNGIGSALLIVVIPAGQPLTAADILVV